MSSFAHSETYTVMEDRVGPCALILPLQVKRERRRWRLDVNASAMRKLLAAFLEDYAADTE